MPHHPRLIPQTNGILEVTVGKLLSNPKIGKVVNSIKPSLDTAKIWISRRGPKVLVIDLRNLEQCVENRNWPWKVVSVMKSFLWKRLQMDHWFPLVFHLFKNFHFAYLDLYTPEVLQVSQVQVYLLEFEMVLHTLFGNHSRGELGFLFELVQQ